MKHRNAYGPTKSHTLNVAIADDFDRLAHHIADGFQVTPIISVYKRNIARSLSKSTSPYYTLMLWAYLENHIKNLYSTYGYTVSTDLINACSTIAHETIRPFIPLKKGVTK